RAWMLDNGERDGQHELHNIWDNANKKLTEGLRHEPPVALGYTRDDRFFILDPTRQIMVFMTSQKLFKPAELLALAPYGYWAAKYPSDEGTFSAGAAAQGLIAECKGAGPFDPTRVRGRGVWREGDDIVINLGGPTPSSKYQYLCFEP